MTHKLIADRELLVSRMAKAISFVPKKSIIPAWQNFMLSISGGMMTIVASDGVMNIKLCCPVDSKTDWAICVPAGLIFQTISNFSEPTVTITLKTEKKIELKSGKSKYNIGMDCFPADFGVLEMKNVTSEITMHQQMLKSAMKVASSFVDKDSAMENFTAMNIAEVNNRIVFTGLRKIFMCRASIRPISINHWESIPVTVDTAKKVIALLSDKGEVSICHSGKAIRFFTDKSSPDHFEVTSKVSTITFPNSESIFSKRTSHHVVLNTLELYNAVKRLSLYCSAGQEPSVKINNDSNSHELVLSSRDIDTDRDGEEIMTITNPEHLSLRRGWNSKALMQILGEVEQTECCVHFDPNNQKSVSFFIPLVDTEEENIYTFLLGSEVEV